MAAMRQRLLKLEEDNFLLKARLRYLEEQSEVLRENVTSQEAMEERESERMFNCSRGTRSHSQSSGLPTSPQSHPAPMPSELPGSFNINQSALFVGRSPPSTRRSPHKFQSTRPVLPFAPSSLPTHSQPY
jgi:hypothetical protein